MYRNIVFKLFYVLSLLTVSIAVFDQSSVIFVKPFVIILLCYIYFIDNHKKNYLIPFSLLLIGVAEVFSVLDFSKYFNVLNIILTVYYIINLMVLRKSLIVIKIKLKKILTGQLIISMILIGYVLYAVTNLILPYTFFGVNIYLYVLLFFFLVFIGVCFYIYLNSKTIVSSSLMVAASCFLIVNITMALNEMYINIAVFPLIINLLQIIGQFFLVKFYKDQDKLTPDGDYFVS